MKQLTYTLILFTFCTMLFPQNLKAQCDLSNYSILWQDVSNLTFTVNLGTCCVKWEPTDNPFGTGSQFYINSTLTVPSNVNLIIEGLDLVFGPLGKIVIEPEARLTLNGTTLKNIEESNSTSVTCDYLWQGINAYGTGALSGDGGVLSILENVEIKGAIYAFADRLLPVYLMTDIENEKINYISSNSTENINEAIIRSLMSTSDFITEFTTLGGDISRENTIPGDLISASYIKNCLIGINKTCYDNSHMGFFRPTFFDGHGGNLLNHNTLPYPLNEFNAEAGVFYTKIAANSSNLIDCFFTYQTFTNLSYGIRAFNMNYQLSTNDFLNNDVGVSVNNAFNISTSYGIGHCDFIDNRVSLQLSGIDNAIIRDNTFQNDDYAVYLRGCDYQVKNNTFINGAFGVVAEESDLTFSLIGGNDFNNYTIPLYSRGNNSGVELLCNDFIDHAMGIVIIDNFVSGNAGILGMDIGNNTSQLGFCNTLFQNPVANTFIGGSLADFVFFPNSYALNYFDYTTTPYTTNDNTKFNHFPTCDPLDAGYCSSYDLMMVEDIDELTEQRKRDNEFMKKYFDYLENDEFALAESMLNNYTSLSLNDRNIYNDIRLANISEAQTKLNNRQNNNLEDQNFNDLHQILLNLQASNRTLLEMTEAEKEVVSSIASSRTKSAFKAQSINFVAQGMEYEIDLPTMPDVEVESSSTVFRQSNDNEDLSNSENFEVLLDKNVISKNEQLLITTNANTSLQVYDLNGIIVKKIEDLDYSYILNVNDFSEGYYILEFVNKKSLKKQVKKLIIK